MTARRSLFLITLAQAPDALARVLDLLLVQGVAIEALELKREAGRGVLRIEASGLDDRQGAFLQQKLKTMPAVRQLASGGFAGPMAAE